MWTSVVNLLPILAPYRFTGVVEPLGVNDVSNSPIHITRNWFHVDLVPFPMPSQNRMKFCDVMDKPCIFQPIGIYWSGLDVVVGIVNGCSGMR